MHRTMAWGDGRLWIYSPKEHAVIAVSPEDGEVLSRVQVPGEGTFGIGCCDDLLSRFPEEPGCGSTPTRRGRRYWLTRTLLRLGGAPR